MAVIAGREVRFVGAVVRVVVHGDAYARGQEKAQGQDSGRSKKVSSH